MCLKDTLIQLVEQFKDDISCLARGNAIGYKELKAHVLTPVNSDSVNSGSATLTQERTKQIYSTFIQRSSSMNDQLKNIAQRCMTTRTGVFYTLFQAEISDFVINDKYIQFDNGLESWKFPFEFTPAEQAVMTDIFNWFNNYWRNQSSLDVKKFDPKYADVDLNIVENFDGKSTNLRFNMIHYSILKSKASTMYIRKSLVEKDKSSVSSFYNTSYLPSIVAPEQLEKLEKLVNLLANKNYIIYGQTGSGKTTFLNYLCLNGLNSKRNLITIEDTDELNIPGVTGYLTSKNYSMSDIFKATLRQNPSHLVIGETRTGEIIDILEFSLTMNVATTLHASSFHKCIERIKTLSKASTKNYANEDVKDLIFSSMDFFIGMNKRKILEVYQNTYKGETLDERFNKIL